MTRRLVGLAAALAMLVALAVASIDEATPTVFERTEHLAAQIRCPVCDGVSVAASPSSTARAIWDDISDRVDRGQTDPQIVDAYADRYGDWILLSPARGGIDGVVLAMPALVIVLAAALVVARRRSSDRSVASGLEGRP